MKNIIFFVPAFISVTAYGFLGIGIGLYLLPSAYVWMAAFLLSGVLLSKALSWGGCIGMLPGIHLMIMSTQDTGQIIPIEMPMGIAIVVFYVVCCVFVWYKKKKALK